MGEFALNKFLLYALSRIKKKPKRDSMRKIHYKLERMKIRPESPAVKVLIGRVSGFAEVVIIGLNGNPYCANFAIPFKNGHKFLDTKLFARNLKDAKKKANVNFLCAVGKAVA